MDLIVLVHELTDLPFIKNFERNLIGQKQFENGIYTSSEQDFRNYFLAQNS